MTPAAFARSVRSRSKHDSVSLPNSRLTDEYNIVKDELADRITQSVSENYFLVPFVSDLEPGIREYAWPSDFQGTIRSVQARIDPYHPEKFVKLERIDATQFEFESDEDAIAANFGNTEGSAGFDIQRSSIYIYSHSIPDLGVDNGGLKMWGAAYPEDITDDRWNDDETDLSVPTDGINLPMPRQMHGIMVDLVVITIKQDGDKPLALTDREQNIEAHIRNKLRLLKRTMKDPSFTTGGFRSTQLSRQYQNGFNL